jgi:hypothetical protein
LLLAINRTDKIPTCPTIRKPVRFPVVVEVNGVKVEIVLLLKPGTAVTVAETKTTTEPEPPSETP